jgi:hypothetical protein
MIAIEKLFDDGEDVLGRNPDVTFLHSFYFFTFYLFTFLPLLANTVPKNRGDTCLPADTASLVLVKMNGWC